MTHSCDWQNKVTLRKFKGKKGTIFFNGSIGGHYRIDGYGPCGYWCTSIEIDANRNITAEGRSAWHASSQVDRYL